MDFLNSRHLTSQDGYIHVFSEPGTYSYAAEAAEQGQTEAGRIIVEASKAAAGKGEQHDIVFRWDPASNRFVPREEDVEKKIKQQDFVVFHFDAAILGQPPCFIFGRADKKVAFDSRSLHTRDAYTHFFMTGGEYSYRVGRNDYRLSATDHRELSYEEHVKVAQQPLVIIVNGSDLSVKHAKIVAGQTVVWAVEKGDDLSIEGFLDAAAPKPGKERQTAPA